MLILFGDKCHFRHVNIICVEQNCSVFDCEKRHPVICKYFRNFRRCKFSNCSYKHDTKNEANSTKEKIIVLETKVMESDKEGHKTLEAFEKIFKEKMDTFEYHIQILKKIIEEKDNKVISLDNMSNEMVKKFESLDKETKEEYGKEKEINQKIKYLENAIKKQSKSTPELLICNECNFTATSKIGLKTNTKRNHTNLRLREVSQTVRV